VAPLGEVAQFLAGAGRECQVVDVSTAKRIELSVHTPLAREPYPAAGFTGVRLMRELARLVQAQRTTLVFTNTRSGAESATFWLKNALPALADRIECHHASLDRDVRQEVEDRLKRGELRAVVCSTSLELGIDIGAVDLVVMLASPKGVTKALQRTGRSGHDIRSTSRGLLMATNVNDLVECCATARLARARHLDPVRLPIAPLDVLAQHLVGLGCTGRWSRADALALVRRSRVYHDLAETEFNDVLDYLAGGGRALRQAYTELFGRLVLDDTHFETRTGMTRRDFLQNVGVIPNEGVTRVTLRSRTLGTVEETFARRLRTGDVFMLGGEPLRVDRHGLMEVFVTRAAGESPTVPRWNANKMPLSNRVCSEIVSFRCEIRARLEAGEGSDALARWIARRLDCGVNNARIILQTHVAQHQVSEIPTAAFLLVEVYRPASDEWPAPPGPPALVVGARARGRVPVRPAPPAVLPCRHYFFHSLIGRAGNDTLSRVVALRLSRRHGGNAVAAPDDYGFRLTVPDSIDLTDGDLGPLLSPAGFAADLEASLERSELLKYHFRNAAQTGLMVYRNYFGEQKPLRKLQFSSEVIFNVLVEHEPDHVLLREARREATHSFLDLAAAEAYLAGAVSRPIRLRTVGRVPPLSFALYASAMRETLLVENPAETLERLYHHWWERLHHAG
jgi:ATP-dependent Lhr-like helicase